MTKRCFIAVKIDPFNALTQAMKEMRNDLCRDKIKWTEENNLHVTLLFMGDTEESLLPDVCERLEAIASDYGNFNISLRSVGIFNKGKKPAVLWIGIENNEQLTGLHTRMSSGLKILGFIPEKRDFNAHLTIGRIRVPGKMQLYKSMILKYKDSFLQVSEVNRFILYESIFSKDGPVYKPLMAFNLGHNPM